MVIKMRLTKRIFSLLLVAALCLCMVLPVSAAGTDHLYDEAGLLSESQANALNAELNAMSERLQFDIIVFTTYSINGWEPEAAAEYLYDQNGFGYGMSHDGVMLLISMEERDWAMTTGGYGGTAINKQAQQYLSNHFVGYLSGGDYAGAFYTFAKDCESLVTSTRNGQVYKTPFSFGTALFISLAVGALVALIAVSVMKSKLKSVHAQTAAANYVVGGSLQVTQANERFLYRNVTRTARVQNTSGPRAGGGGGGHVSSHGKF